MIQRKQTLWLGLIFLICIASVYLNIPFLEISGKLDNGLNEDVLAGIGFSHTEIDVSKDRPEILPNTILKYNTLISGFIAFVCIFLYKHHNKQLLLGKLIYLGIIGICFGMYYYGWATRYVDEEPKNQIIISVLFPFILAWANYKAMSGIKLDLSLVKSYDRIR